MVLEIKNNKNENRLDIFYPIFWLYRNRVTQRSLVVSVTGTPIYESHFCPFLKP